MRIKKTKVLYTFLDDTELLERKVKELEQDLKKNYDFVKNIGKSVAKLLKIPSVAEKANMVADNTIEGLSDLDAKIEVLKTDIAKDISKSVAELLKKTSGAGAEKAKIVEDTVESWNKQLDAKTEVDDCLFAAEEAQSKPDIQMLELYGKMKFDNPDGGVWKQGWDVQYNQDDFTEQNKLKVFVVPHSHNDPGWIKTFEKYYEDQTRHILNNMVHKVSEEPNRKFIWAEISYLDLWWKESDQATRDKLRKLVQNGQVEIVTGGWVMNDEANTHHYAMIEQLSSGHEWLRQKLNFAPKNGWAIDPFGMSSSMAYLLKRSGLENMVIQRVHYAVKKALAAEKNLEFNWRQNWDRDGQTDMFCHLMPFYSYDVPHTCGPDPKVCCQYDFRRLSGPGQSPIYCPWKVNPVVITESNVERKASVLLDQYRKKSSLYKTNVLLVQLGDDFRYDTAGEFDQQFTNYRKLFDYMNGRADWLVEAQFGTLQDYFQALRDSVAQSIDRFPSLSGDFFTYADIDDHYWSGYYTTRPFYKHMDRMLQSSLRSAEIIYSMTWSHLHRLSTVPESYKQWMGRLMTFLTEARHNMGLFQHHDGVTGTAKDHVVQDYARRMQRSIQDSQRVIEQCGYYLLHPNQANFNPDIDVVHFVVDDEHAKANELPARTLIQMIDGSKEKRLVLYNSLATERIQVVTVRLSHFNVRVVNERSQALKVQLSPVFTTNHQVSRSEFDISFIASISPLGMTTYTISAFDGTLHENTNLEVSKIVVKESRSLTSVEPFKIEVQERLQPFTLKNLYLEAEFGVDGLLTSVSVEGRRFPLATRFYTYSTRRGQSMSGAYLFLPDGTARVMATGSNHYVRVIQGSIRSQVVVHMPQVVHQVTMHHSPGVDGVGLQMDNLVNLSDQNNMEVAMRFETNLQSGQAFYTDLNGLQMTRRERFDKLPLQAHFYPMPTMAYIEDSTARLTLASGQPLGVASLKSGQLEVMLDRRLNQDDNRGLGQGVLDNVIPTLDSFRLLFELRQSSCKKSHQRPDGYPSLTAHRSLHELLYPIHQLSWKGQQPIDEVDSKLHLNFKPALAESGADIHLVNLRTATELPDDAAARPAQTVSLLLHRVGFDCCFPAAGLNSTTRHGHFSLDQLFPDYFGQRVRATSLTSSQQGPAIEKSFIIALKPMEIYSFELQP